MQYNKSRSLSVLFPRHDILHSAPSNIRKTELFFIFSESLQCIAILIVTRGVWNEKKRLVEYRCIVEVLMLNLVHSYSYPLPFTESFVYF